MKKLSILVLGVLLSASCMGCSLLTGSGKGLEPDESVSYVELDGTADDEERTQEEQSHFHIETDNFKLDADMELPQGIGVTYGMAKRVQLLDSVPAIKEKYITEKWTETTSDGMDENGNASVIYDWRLGGYDSLEKYIHISPLWMSIMLDINAISQEQAAFRLETTDKENGQLYLTNRNLDFMTIPDCIAQVENDLLSLNLPVGQLMSCHCYTLDAETMREQDWMQDVEDGTEKRTGLVWGNEDNYYKVYARQSFQGIPIYLESLDGTTLSDICKPIRVLYGKNGICGAEIDKILRCEAKGEAIKLLPTRQIADIMSARYQDILSENEFEVERVEFMYYAKKIGAEDYELIPSWVFEVQEHYTNSTFEYTDWGIVIINAETGEEVSTE